MNKDEGQILTEVANDVKWLKSNAEQGAIELNKKLDRIDSHFTILNGSVKSNTVWRKMITGIGGTIVLALAGAILALAMRVV
jgi:hypothetical protein